MSGRPSSFAVTSAGQRVNLGISGTAQASFTVTNTSTQTLKGRMLTRPSDSASPEWFSVVGESVRDFGPNEAEQVVVQLSVPPAATPGPYSFRLDAVSAVDPDEDFTQGPSVAFDVEAQAPSKKKFPWVPWWILAIAAGVVLLIILGVVVFLLVRGGGGETRVISSGRAWIPANQFFDVDAGTVLPAGGREADVLWQSTGFVSGSKVAPAGRRSATLALIGLNVDFDAIDAKQLSSLTYKAEPIPASMLQTNSVFAVRSARRTYAKVQLSIFDLDILVLWVTYRRG
jgi:hypothetical protein